MNSYMVSLKYDFEKFRSTHWLYTDTLQIFQMKFPLSQNDILSFSSLCPKARNSKMDQTGKQKSREQVPYYKDNG